MRALLQPMRPLSSALVLSGTSVLSPKFVQPGCTATTNRIQVGEMLLYEEVEAYKKEPDPSAIRVAHST
jgi:hypothetical protein